MTNIKYLKLNNIPIHLCLKYKKYYYLFDSIRLVKLVLHFSLANSHLLLHIPFRPRKINNSIVPINMYVHLKYTCLHILLTLCKSIISFSVNFSPVKGCCQSFLINFSTHSTVTT